LRLSEEATNVMLSKLEKSSMEAKREADAVAKIKEVCQADAERISGEKVFFILLLFLFDRITNYIRLMQKKILQKLSLFLKKLIKLSDL
jgi:hypothetical protein